MGYSARHIDKSCIFRQTFQNGEYDVINNPYGKAKVINAMTFSNGYASGSYSTASYLDIQSIITKCTGTLRLVCRFRSDANYTDLRTLIDLRTSGGDGFIISQATTKTFRYSSGTGYVNGEPRTSLTYPLENNIIYDLIISSMTMQASLININRTSVAFTNQSDLDIFLVEIYNRALTANEVKLLYQNKLYKKPKVNETNCVFHLDVKDGIINDKSSYNRPLTLTIVNLQKNIFNDLYFNVNSSIDTGTDWIGTDEIWGYFWIKPESVPTYANHSIFGNSRFYITYYVSGQGVFATSNASTLFFSSANSKVLRGKYTFVGFTRKINGMFNFYVNSYKNIETTTGTPVSGTTVIGIGQYAGNGGFMRFTKLKIFKEKIPGNIDEIMLQLYNSEKSYYGV